MKEELGRFLSIDPDEFIPSQGIVNESRISNPSYAILARIYKGTLKKLVPDAIANSMAKRSLSKKAELDFLPADFNRLLDIFDTDIKRTSELTGLSLDSWMTRRDL